MSKKRMKSRRSPLGRSRGNKQGAVGRAVAATLPTPPGSVSGSRDDDELQSPHVVAGSGPVERAAGPASLGQLPPVPAVSPPALVVALGTEIILGVEAESGLPDVQAAAAVSAGDERAAPPSPLSELRVYPGVVWSKKDLVTVWRQRRELHVLPSDASPGVCPRCSRQGETPPQDDSWSECMDHGALVICGCCHALSIFEESADGDGPRGQLRSLASEEIEKLVWIAYPSDWDRGLVRFCGAEPAGDSLDA